MNELSFSDIFGLVRRWWVNRLWIALMTFTALFAGLAYTEWQARSAVPTYEASVTIYVVYDFQGKTSSANLLEGYQSLMSSQGLYNEAGDTLAEWSISPQEARNSIQYSVGTTTMTITSITSNPTWSVQIVNTVADTFIKQVESAAYTSALQVLDYATWARPLEGDSRLQTVVIFALLGFTAACFLIAIYELHHGILRTTAQCTRDAHEILAVIPLRMGDRKQ